MCRRKNVFVKDSLPKREKNVVFNRPTCPAPFLYCGQKFALLFFLKIYLFIHLFIYLFIYLSIYLLIDLFID